MSAIEKKCETILARFAEKGDIAAAKRCIRALVRAVGPGFHPDTKFSEYIFVVGKTSSVFDSELASRLDGVFEAVLLTLEMSDVDPCEVALPLQRRMLAFAD